MVAPPRARIPEHPAKPPNRTAFGSSRFRRFRPDHRPRPSFHQSITPQRSPFTQTAGQAARTLHARRCSQNSAHSRNASVEGHNRRIINSAGSLRHARRCPGSLSTATTARSAARVACALAALMHSRTPARSQAHQRARCGLWQSILPTQCPHNWPACRLTPSIAGFWPIGPMTDDHRKGLHARAILPVPTLEVRKACGRARHQARNGRRNADAVVITQHIDIVDEKTGGGRGVGGNSVARRIIDINPVFRGLFRRNPGLPKSARLSPRKSRSAKTQRRLRGELRVVSGVWVAAGARIHQRPSGGLP
jgi:hypothetical protein